MVGMPDTDPSPVPLPVVARAIVVAARPLDAVRVHFFVDGSAEPCAAVTLSPSNAYAWGEALVAQVEDARKRGADLDAGADWALPESSNVAATLRTVDKVGESCMVIAARAMAGREGEQHIMVGPAGVTREASMRFEHEGATDGGR